LSWTLWTGLWHTETMLSWTLGTRLWHNQTMLSWILWTGFYLLRIRFPWQTCVNTAVDLLVPWRQTTYLNITKYPGIPRDVKFIYA
jgi:hypothetical protein